MLKLYLLSLAFLSMNLMASEFDYSGSLKFYPLFREDIYRTKNGYSFQGLLKNNFLYSVSESQKLESSYELTAIHDKNKTLEKKHNYRAYDLNSVLTKNENLNTDKHHYYLVQNLNRFNYNYSYNIFDLSIGRQAISFGSSKSINPTDVIAPTNITTIDREDKNGVDSIIVKKSLAENLLLETGAILGSHLKSTESAVYLRPRLSLYESEIIITAMKFKKDYLLGMDIQRSILDAGFWFESSFIDSKDYFRITSGIDYKFQSSLYLSGEYHYNGSSNKYNQLTKPEYLFLKDKHYMIITTSYEFTPLIMSSLQSYYNYYDHSFFNIFKIDYSLSDNSSFGFGSFFTFNNPGTTEFGKLGKTTYLNFKLYF